jgi:hypothetical protein
MDWYAMNFCGRILRPTTSGIAFMLVTSMYPILIGLICSTWLLYQFHGIINIPAIKVSKYAGNHSIIL